MKKTTQFLLLTVALVFSTVAMAQSTITGTVIDAEVNAPLPGANIIEKGTTNGVSSDFDGKFTLTTKATSGQIVVSYVGYGSVTLSFNGSQDLGQITLSADNSLGEIVIVGIADVAVDRKTPIAVSSIKASEIALKVGNMEFPEIMNSTPGVYATKTGGGYGDSRISLRGFDQTNTSILINGQPVNDMENGSVYWSNWQGLTDVASGIQIQRGVGASRLAVPSVGGTISIFTKASERTQGGSVAQVIGNDAYTKTTASYSTGQNDKGWSSSFLLSKWSGDGYVNGTKGSGWTYFAAVGYAPEGSKHEFNFSFLGAGQWHHQRSSWVSIRDYQNFGDSGIDRKWNTDAGFLNGEEFNMRRNFYNKPLATFNWDYEITDNIKLATSLYGSAGRGGGTGPRGNNFRNSDIDLYPFNIDLTEHLNNRGNGAASRNPDGSINFDNVVNVNRTTTTPYSGAISGYNGLLIGSNGFRDDGVNRAVLVRRASMNSHDWVGMISNLDIKTGKMRYSVGVDLRDYTGYHYRALENLMGLDAYYSTGNQNSAGEIIETTIDASPFKKTGLKGPKIDYYNIGYVGWQGFNGLAEYSGDSFTAVLQGGLSNQSFQREDLFDQPTNPLSKKKNVGGGYIKGGANYNLNDANNVFFNAGYISRQPNFDAVFPGFANDINPDLQNEKITSFEIGYGLRLPSFTMNINLYTTKWGNRFISRSFTIDGGATGTAQFKNIEELHNGFELEANYTPTSNLKLKGMLSIGDWKYTKDFTSTLFDDTNTQIGTGTLYTKDAKIGDAAQFVAFMQADYSVSDHLAFDLGWRNVNNLYADYSILDSDFTQPDNKGALKLPAYNLIDLGATYRFNLFGNNASARLNINNLFNEEYIAESNTNIHADGSNPTYKGIDVRNSVWFGFGTTWNFSLRYNF
ncbi:TonB-dependent receptor [Yeosuana marina]|uniref:TonB-dependent receptor n=1 Tax=Yeosuana marina TaxID=1565536 RepID=UPI0014210D13|nr:TonB-dependent receptor [Yeosuana marina]